MANEQLKPGDVVELKSGGPTMTVQWVDKSSAHCAWFVSQEHKSATFATASLKLVDDR